MFGDEINIFEEVKNVPGIIPGMRPAHIYPSSTSVKLANGKVYGGCQRKQFLQYKGERGSDFRTDDESLGVFMAGDQIQDVIEGRFKQGGIFVQSELPVYLPEWNVSGRIDTIIHKTQPDGTEKLFGVEVKSKSGYYAQTTYIDPLKSEPAINFRPADEHILQSMVYMHACNTQPHLIPYNIKKWILLYILRDNYKFNYFELELTDDSYVSKDGSKSGYGYPIIYSKVKPEGFVYNRYRVKDFTDRWDELNNCLQNDILPDRDYKNIYSDTDLQIMSANGELSNTYSALVAKGKFSQITQDLVGCKEPKGDSACAYCEYRSKCWGLGQYSENSFTEVNRKVR